MWSRPGCAPQLVTTDPPGEYVQERHQRDKTEDPPHQFSAPPQVRPVGGQVDPHEDHSHGMQKTNQDLKQLLHNLNLPRSAGAVPAPVIHVVPCRPPPEPAGADAACALRIRTSASLSPPAAARSRDNSADRTCANGVREMSVMELLGKPDDQIVVHDHSCSVAQRRLATACSPAIRKVPALGI